MPATAVPVAVTANYAAINYVINTDSKDRTGATATASAYSTSDYQNIIFKSDDALSGELAGASGLSVSGVVKLVKTFKTSQWYPVGFPFAINNISIKYGATTVTGVIYDGDQNSQQFTDNGSANCNFFVKKYDGATNVFLFTPSIAPNKGYIVEFIKADFGNADEVEVTFTSPTGPSLTSATSQSNHTVAYDGNDYTLVVNPYVSSITDGLSGAGAYYQYNYSASEPRFDLVDETTLSTPLRPFEAIVAVPAGNTIRRSIGTGLGNYTALDLVEVNDPVITTKYYSLQGIEIKKPIENGLYIVKKIHASKKEDVSKIIYKK
jgi:hypothetical protein